MSHNKQNKKQQQQSNYQNQNGQLKMVGPEPEVVVRAERRRFSRAYKLDILAQAEQCTNSGQIGALLRREGLYSSHLTRWRQAQERGRLEPAKRGRKANPQAAELAGLKKENERLKKQLEQAELIIDVQKKVSQLVGLNMDPSNGSE